MNQTDDKAQANHLPPVFNSVEKHGVFPEVSHDENARFNFLTTLHQHLGSVLKAGNKIVFDKRVKPQFQASNGRDFKSAPEIKQAMEQDPRYQMWSALQRSMLEMTQQSSRSMILRQIDKLAEKAKYYNKLRPETLKLDPNFVMPRYATMVDYHGLPGGYYAAYIPGDVANAASEDASTFVTTGGKSGKRFDGSGRAVVEWLKENYPGFKPRRIIDLGCSIGHNTLPLAIGYPDAQIIGLDVSETMLRYAHARAVALGVDNVSFIQASAESLPFEDESFDWVQSTNFLHETAASAMNNIGREAYRVLAINGLMLHVEQAPFTADTTFFEQFSRDWDTFNNNEPFWGVMHKMDKAAWMKSAGFRENDLLQFGTRILNDQETNRSRPVEYNHGFITQQNVFGAWKK